MESGDRLSRYSYTLTNGEYRLTGVSACSSGTSPACVGTANESRTVIAYNSQGLVSSVERLGQRLADRDHRDGL